MCPTELTLAGSRLDKHEQQYTTSCRVRLFSTCSKGYKSNHCAVFFVYSGATVVHVSTESCFLCRPRELLPCSLLSHQRESIPKNSVCRLGILPLSLSLYMHLSRRRSLRKPNDDSKTTGHIPIPFFQKFASSACGDPLPAPACCSPLRKLTFISLFTVPFASIPKVPPTAIAVTPIVARPCS